jgi:PilZ domain
MEYATPRSPRYSFIAIAEIIHPESGGILGSRVAKISLNGCFVDTPKTIPVGSEVVIKIFAESECFAATAKVVYANSTSGVGLAFRKIRIKSVALLRQWLQRASAVPNKPNS